MFLPSPVFTWADKPCGRRAAAAAIADPLAARLRKSLLVLILSNRCNTEMNLRSGETRAWQLLNPFTLCLTASRLLWIVPAPKHVHTQSAPLRMIPRLGRRQA